jgi:hypothetical protein
VGSGTGIDGHPPLRLANGGDDEGRYVVDGFPPIPNSSGGLIIMPSPITGDALGMLICGNEKKYILTQAGEIVERQCKNVGKDDDRSGVLFYGYRGKGWLLFTCVLVDVLEVVIRLC